MSGRLAVDGEPETEDPDPMSSDNRFFAVLGLLSLGGGAAILLGDTPFSPLAGWFGVASGAGLLLFLAYRLFRAR